MLKRVCLMTNSNGKYVVGELDEVLVFIATICCFIC
jgi:hypothetical protein